MTKEKLECAIKLRTKMNTAVNQLRGYMRREERVRAMGTDPLKEQYFASKVEEWRDRLNEMKKEFAELV